MTPTPERAAQVVSALKRRYFQAQYVPDRAAARAAIAAMLPEGASVFVSESTTLEQLGVRDTFRAAGRNKVTYVPDAEPAQQAQLEREAFYADVFMGSATAITLDGHIVKGDSHGKTVAPMIFGPAKVVIVVGMNKVVQDKAAAFGRVAALHATDGDPRLSYNSTGMLESALPRFTQRINVLLVGEELGR
jgi:DeoR/GlpR family transcriptional regulator of sugar metabolism